MSMPGVVYLASWPRSGNTLLRAILWQCFGLESCSMHCEDSMYARNPEWHKLTGAIRFPHRMKEVQQIVDEQGVALFKTHDRPEALADVPDELRTIYLIRDGREACVSYWHYYREILEDSTMTLERIIRGDCLFGSWSDHLRAWASIKSTMCPDTGVRMTSMQSQTQPMTPVFWYEHLFTAATVRRLESWLNVRRLRFFIRNWQDFQQSDPQFFRSGTNDTWKTEMTGDDLVLFDELHGDTMREYGYYPAREPAYA